MGKRKTVLAISPIKDVMKGKVGKGVRVSKSAIMIIHDAVVDMIENTTKGAWALAKHANRKGISAKDVILALQGGLKV